MENREIKRLSAENEEIKRRIAKIKVENTANELREQTVFQEDVFVLNDVSLIKTLKIYAVEETGASVKLTFLPEEVHERWIFVNCNDCAFKIYSNGEISKDIPVFLKKGENLLTVEICQDIKDEISTSTLKIEVSGLIENRLIEPRLTYLNDYLIGFTNGDTISVYASDLSKLILSRTRNDGGCVAYEESYGIMILHKDVLTGDANVEYYYEDGWYNFDEPFPHQFSSSAIVVINGRRFVFTVKDNQVYKIDYEVDRYSEEKFPIKAKKISTVRGVNGYYLSYVDLKNNFVTVTLDGEANPIEYKSWGKMENAHVDDFYDMVTCSYKYGKTVVIKREKDPAVYPISVGDELMRVNKDISILRKGNKLIQIMEE